VLTPHQAQVAQDFLADRARERTHLVVYLSGAHAYGFASPDSDLDLKCVHVAPTAALVGLSPPDDPTDRIEIVQGVELDYGSNELAPVLRGIIKGNGNYIERLLGDLALAGDDRLLGEARLVVRPLLSRLVAKHYRGFATSQLAAFDGKPSAKRALYVLRTAATGRCLLDTGEVITDVAQLRDYVPAEIEELLAIKRTGEKQELEASHAAAWRTRLADAVEGVSAAWPTSCLPEHPVPKAIDAASSWLIDVRRQFFA
ncbi:MAG TPA: nucleotidyltransferase domain-containing protein, partial [Kofleriaceae bacterium]|nr:nucleotidyltransferase domain-containing protein [Kofleriaceae bacterium]